MPDDEAMNPDMRANLAAKVGPVAMAARGGGTPLAQRGGEGGSTLPHLQPKILLPKLSQNTEKKSAITRNVPRQVLSPLSAALPLPLEGKLWAAI
jgi:hypothetical protein